MIWFGLLAILAALLSIFAFFPRFRIGLLIVILAFSFVSVTEILGVSKPSRLEWRAPAKTIIIAYHLVENKAIYLWVIVNGRPAAYSFPWSLKMAQKIQRAFRRARRGGARGVQASKLFGVRKRGRGYYKQTMPPKFIPIPRDSMPPKQPNTLER
jgi:hypothetical protein